MLVSSLSSCLVAGKTLTEKNNGDSLNLKINDNVDESIVSVTSPEFMEYKKDKELVGAGGYEIFTIKAIAKGKTDIILNYERPWEEGVEPLEIFEITISID